MGTILLKENQRDVSNLGPKVTENREDINSLKARMAMGGDGIIRGRARARRRKSHV